MSESDRQQLSIEEQQVLDRQERLERAQSALEHGNLLAVLAYHKRIDAVQYSSHAEPFGDKELHRQAVNLERRAQEKFEESAL